MSADEMPCGCLGHADNAEFCRYPKLEETLTTMTKAYEQAAAELQNHKEHKAIAAFFGGPDEESVNSAKLARKTLAELATLRAENARLREALTFCADRLVYVYKESPNVDFILTARRALEEG